MTAALVLVCFGVIGVAVAQDPPAREGRERRERDGATFVEPTTPGVSLKTSDVIEAAATAEAFRTQFDPIPADVAFEIWLEGYVLGKAGESAPDAAPADPAAAPASATTVPVLRVSLKEWDDYFALMTKDAPQGLISKYRTGLLTSMLDQKSILLFHRAVLPDVEQRAAAAIRKLKRGAAFKDVVKGHSEDDTSKQVDGLCAEDSRSGLMTMYPFAKVMFEMKEGEITGPIYNKSAAYILRLDRFTRSNNPWHDQATASGIVIKYTSKNMGAKALGMVKSAIRVRTELDRFKKIVPPAMQVPLPTTYGPTDIAPLGEPDAPLSRD